ncbi:alkaline phosphatase PhoX [Luteirhabdus pelagi]|uniref:alkaline phosphatase PhoX n=1 Tax=Luteirhabdus pelagi TaxID=2792783 RepID=UPI001939C8E6|nr:alkaline phosphatase PhoX [Luteirhabdus pelagi]
MKTKLLAIFSLAVSAIAVAQNEFPSVVVETDWEATEVVVPPSPFQYQVLFIGSEDMVQTGINEEVPAKQWHDFIGFTPLTAEDCVDDPNAIGWASVNHEMILSDDKIGDGGGMTAFLLGRNPSNDELYVIPQTLTDGRSGDFFNVDFSAVGETGMNCGGINSNIDGRIWTAEEWFRTNNESIYDGGNGVRDTTDYTIKYTQFEMANFQTIPKYQNFNWMVEIDPRAAKAVRKQYNWGRQPFEGGTVANDNQTVYMGADATPGFFTKFVADTPGDFTEGTTYVYKHDAGGDPWVEIDNEDFTKMLNFGDEAVSAGATMFNRLEWVTIDKTTGKIYMTETGRDNPAGSWEGEAADGAVYAPHHIQRATDQGVSGPGDADYWDYYGRVLEYDPATGEVNIYVEGGPYFETSPALDDYPNKHLSNPDGLNMLYVNVAGEDKRYMLINEDLNGTSFGRTPLEYPNDRMCEMYILDMDVENPGIDDLIRLTQTPRGAEITGACATTDGKSVLVNSQHPDTSNPFPYNNSLTFAITGFDDSGAIATLSAPEFDEDATGFVIYPNPTERIVYFNQVSDVALYNISGQRIAVYRNVKSIDISGLATGTYLLRNGEGETKKLLIK